jgi:DNA-directed RNA polymerase specialized sigma subunit
MHWSPLYLNSSHQGYGNIMDIKDFMPLVKIIAQNIHRPLPSNIMMDDLVQDGMIGLIMAFREHDSNTVSGCVNARKSGAV